MSPTLRDVAKALVLPLARRAARMYLAGPRLEDALAASRGFHKAGRSTTLGYWNETGDPPRAVADAYLEAAAAVAEEGLGSRVSVKAPAFQFSLDLFAEILARTRGYGLPLHLDALQHEAAVPTFAMLDRGVSSWRGDVGVTLPGRWRRSLGDADWAIERGTPVRVVKGQWADPEDAGRDPTRGYLEVIERLAGRAASVSIASHDPSLVRQAARVLRASGTSAELELLPGFPLRRVLAAGREFSLPVRMFVPYGFPYIPYSPGQVARRPIILWWLVRDALRKRHPEPV